MRNLYSGFLLGLLLISSSLFYGIALTNSDKKFQQNSSVLDGTWRLVAVHQLDPSGRVLADSAPVLNTLKIVANRHFSRINATNDGRIISTSAGLIELNADQYNEYHSLEPDNSAALTYQWQLSDGKLTQRRIDQDRVTEEVWQLVD